MPYRALYRAWRPRRFADLVGQEHVARTLRNAVVQGRAAHAYLFCGPRGTGKTSAARILAQALNCEAPADGEPCGGCATCRHIEAERFLDIIEIDAASNRGIEEMRDLRERVRYAPAAGLCKVYIVDEVHMLTDPAWNAFLKTLEEPPERTVFILATTDPHRVPSTVLSRCQRFEFRRLTVERIGARLAQVCAGEGLKIDPPMLEAIAQRSEGALRDALSLLDQAVAYAGPEVTVDDLALILGTADDAAIERLLASVAAGDARRLLAETEALYLAGKDFARVASDLAQAARDRLSAALAAQDVAAAALWLRGAESLADLEAAMRRTSQPRLMLEVTLLRWQLDGQAEPAGPVQGGSPLPPATAPRPSTAPPGTRVAGGVGVAQPPPVTPAAEAPPAPQAPPAPAAVAAPSPPSPLEPRPSVPDGEPTLAGVQAAWPQVLAVLRRIERSAQVTFQDARVVALAEGKLTLALQPGYHLVAPSKRPALQKALETIIGVRPALEFIVDERPAAASTGRAESRGGQSGGDDPPVASEPASLHKEALDLFDGRTVELPGFDAGGGDHGIW